MVLACLGCSTEKYAYHTAYRVSGCDRVISRERVAEGLAKRGFLHLHDEKGPYDIYRRPRIAQKGPLAREPYEDKGGEMAVAVCPAGSESFLLAEEWKPCQNDRQCGVEDQEELGQLARGWGCQVNEHAKRSKAWSLEDRQDWTKASCNFIVENISF